jgi:selenide,water dikinase
MRQGRPLAANLRRALRGESCVACVPPRRALALIATGGRHAVACRGRLVVAGDWVWRWKDRIDGSHMAKFALPETVELEAPPPDQA